LAVGGETIGTSFVPVSGSLQPAAGPASADAPKVTPQTMPRSKAFPKIILVVMSEFRGGRRLEP
jgi:hypothetical protein